MPLIPTPPLSTAIPTPIAIAIAPHTTHPATLSPRSGRRLDPSLCLATPSGQHPRWIPASLTQRDRRRVIRQITGRRTFLLSLIIGLIHRVHHGSHINTIPRREGLRSHINPTCSLADARPFRRSGRTSFMHAPWATNDDETTTVAGTQVPRLLGTSAHPLIRSKRPTPRERPHASMSFAPHLRHLEGV